MSEETIPELKSVEDLAAEIKGEKPKEADITEDPKASERYTFQFRFEDVRGKAWVGKFTNRILTIRQKRQYKILKAQLTGGTSIDALDGEAWMLAEQLAHLSISLERNSDFPKWAKDLESILDERVIAALYEEVASHEATFHRRIPPTGDGQTDA